MELIILTGHRKSGTTMLHRLFDSYSGICLYPVDLSILYAYFPLFAKNNDLSKIELRSRLNHVIETSLNDSLSRNNQNKKFITKYLAKLDDVLIDTDLRSKYDIINGMYEACVLSQKISDRSLPFMFKETSQSIYFKYFKDKFPKLRMVSLIRDPRDNFASIKSGIGNYYSNFGENTNTALGSLINRAKMDLSSAWINQKHYSDSFLAIRYEDLVKDPEKLIKKVAKFLDLKFSKSLLIPTSMGEIYHGNNFDGKKFNSISSNQVGKWGKRISKEEAMIIEYWLGDLMKKWGYEFEFTDQEKQLAFIEFYEWYNSQYFYKDSFKK
tara:strand:- start:1833 stop:2807 length:975 start_codon:yes stop_codon:yes gene_type:complete